jgi:hypothetical protein
MQERRRLRSQPNAVDQHLRIGIGILHGHLTIGHALQNRTF